MRLETFSLGGGWVHDKVKNHGAGSKIVSTDRTCATRLTVALRWHDPGSSIYQRRLEMIRQLAFIAALRYALGLLKTTHCKF